MLVKCMPHGATMDTNISCETLKKRRQEIQNLRRVLLFSGILLLHDNTRPHVGEKTKQLLAEFK